MQSYVELDLQVFDTYRDAMANMVTIRRLIKILRPLGVKLRAVAMIGVMVFAMTGLTFQPCQCGTCACSQAGQSCCCSETPSCCDCGCENSDCGCESSDCSCSCTFCMCGIGVAPTSLPKVNDSVTPMVFTTAISQIAPEPCLLTSFQQDRTAVASQTHLYALHCRWLI